MLDSMGEKSSLDKFVFIYQNLGKHNLHQLESVYAANVKFIDPAHEINGWDNLHRYFRQLYSNINSCSFVIHNTVMQGDNAFLNWSMHFSHPRLEKGKQKCLSGCTRLKMVDGMVLEHQDYFDMGAMIYESLPILGRLIRTIKRNLGTA